MGIQIEIEVQFQRKQTGPKNYFEPKIEESAPAFNNANVSHRKSQKHLGIILDSKLAFEEHYKTVLSKTNRTIGLLRKLQNLMPREALLTIYKAFARCHLDYNDVLFGQAFNA